MTSLKDTGSHDVQRAYRQARLSRDPRFDGIFFVAVISTGIFCRPICPARLPMEKNVQYYAVAAQALQDGFRPCLRCRPDSAPDSPAWRGVATTTERAQRLLSELPAQPVSQVAQRLGISERYLHSLMRQHLGLTPKQVQIYSQLWFARRLLVQTHLSVTDVAFACGLQSARRLQDLMKKYWDKTPTMLRDSQRSSQHSADISLFLPCQSPYNWPQVRDFIAAHCLERVEDVGDNHYARAFNWEKSEGYIHAAFDARRCGFEVTLQLTDLQYIQPVMANLARMLDTNAQPAVIHEALSAAGISDQYLTKGLRFPGTWDAFEAGCRAIVGQQISFKAATSYINRLDAYIDKHNQFGAVFPTAQDVLSQPPDFLKMPASRQRTLMAFADVCIQANAVPDTRTLLAVKGIGPWTCEYIELRGYNACDIYLNGDLIVRNMAKALSVIPDNAAPWRSYLTLQLWHIALEERAQSSKQKQKQQEAM